MSFRDEFIELAPKLFEKELAKSKAQEEARQLIDDFFTSLQTELEEVLDVAKNNFEIRATGSSYKVIVRKLNDSRLELNYKDSEIKVKILPYGYGYDDTLYFHDSEMKYYTSRLQKPLSEELLTYYLEQAFKEPLASTVK
ncbi:hypothetical protein [Priestia megaterium]